MVGDEDRNALVLNRLRRAQGQLAGAISQIEQGVTARGSSPSLPRSRGHCKESRVQDRRYEFARMSDLGCGGGNEPMTEAELEKLALALA
jgi:hypothetical protein